VTLAYVTYEDQQAVKDGRLTVEVAQARALDRLGTALQRIERVCGWDDHDGNAAVEIAREALDG
jgi:hypothetical protein